MIRRKIVSLMIIMAIVSGIILSTIVSSSLQEPTTPIVLQCGGSNQGKSIQQNLALFFLNSQKSTTTLKYETMEFGDAIGSLGNGTLNYVSSEQTVSDSMYTAHTDLQMIPFAARSTLVVYNLPKDVLNSDQLILDRVTVARIFLGEIEFWDDKAITDSNPGKTFPHERIRRIVRSDVTDTTTIFTSALSKFSDTWRDSYGTFANPNEWPANTTLATDAGTLGLAKTVFLTSYSIGYNTPEAELQQFHKNALLVNKKGKVTDGTQFSHLQSAMKDYENSFSERFTVDIQDGDSVSSYPIAGYTYLVYRSENEDCEKAVELYKYFNFIYQGSSVEIVLSNTFVPIDTIVASRVLDKLKTWKCMKSDGTSTNVADLVAQQKVSSNKNIGAIVGGVVGGVGGAILLLALIGIIFGGSCGLYKTTKDSMVDSLL